MTRARRKPAAPNLVKVICTGRGEPGHGENRLAELQGYTEAGLLRFAWVPRGKGGEGPVTGRRRGPEGWHTISVRCGTCGRDFQRHEEQFGEIVKALGKLQGTSGERPVVVDISRVENSL